jgi:uncharacterized membrane-anchored protein
MTTYLTIFALLLLFAASIAAIGFSLIDDNRRPRSLRLGIAIVGIAGIALLITLMLQLKAKREAGWRHYAATNRCTVQQLGSTQEASMDMATVINSDGSTGTAMVPGKDTVAVAVWYCENTGETHVRKIR